MATKLYLLDNNEGVRNNWSVSTDILSSRLHYIGTVYKDYHCKVLVMSLTLKSFINQLLFNFHI